MDTLVAQAFGANDRMDTRRTLVNGSWLALGLSPVLAGVILALIPVLRAAGVNPRVMVDSDSVHEGVDVGHSAACCSTPPSAATCRPSTS